MATAEKITKYGKQLLKAVNDVDFNKVKYILKICPKCVNEKDMNGNTALIFAAWKGSAEIVKELINAGVKLEEKSNSTTTALLMVGHYGHTEVLKELINAGVKLDEKDHLGRTALILAAVNTYTEVVKILLVAGADATILGEGGTALQCAEKNGKIECIKILKTDIEELPTCEEIGLLPPEERMTKIKREQPWQNRITAAANEKGGSGMGIE